MNEFVAITVERWWIDEEDGYEISGREATSDRFGRHQIEQLRDEVLVAIVRELIGRTGEEGKP